MITATVRYKLPPQIDDAACRAHFHKIAPGFRDAKGLISKHFISRLTANDGQVQGHVTATGGQGQGSESRWTSVIYQWETLEDAKAFYSGPRLDGVVERYVMRSQIE